MRPPNALPPDAPSTMGQLDERVPFRSPGLFTGPCLIEWRRSSPFLVRELPITSLFFENSARLLVLQPSQGGRTCTSRSASVGDTVHVRAYAPKTRLSLLPRFRPHFSGKEQPFLYKETATDALIIQSSHAVHTREISLLEVTGTHAHRQVAAARVCAAAGPPVAAFPSPTRPSRCSPIPSPSSSQEPTLHTRTIA